MHEYLGVLLLRWRSIDVCPPLANRAFRAIVLIQPNLEPIVIVKGYLEDTTWIRANLLQYNVRE